MTGFSLNSCMLQDILTHAKPVGHNEDFFWFQNVQGLKQKIKFYPTIMLVKSCRYSDHRANHPAFM